MSICKNYLTSVKAQQLSFFIEQCTVNGTNGSLSLSLSLYVCVCHPAPSGIKVFTSMHGALWEAVR